MAEFIYDFPDEVLALHMCGFTFDEAVRLADQEYNNSEPIIRRCIEVYFGNAGEGDENTILPNYHECVVTEEEIKDAAIKMFRRYFSRKLHESLKRSPVEGITAEQFAAMWNSQNPLPPPTPVPDDNSDDDEDLPF